MTPRITIEAPTPVNFIRLIQRNIVANLRRRQPAMVALPPLVERAFQIVNLTKNIVSQDYSGDTEFLARQ